MRTTRGGESLQWPVVHGLDHHAAAIPVGTGLYLFPIELLGGFRDLTVEWEGRRCRMELLFQDKVAGVAGAVCDLEWAHNEYALDQTGNTQAAWFANAFEDNPVLVKELPEPTSGMAWWVLDAKYQIARICREEKGKWREYPLATLQEWLAVLDSHNREELRSDLMPLVGLLAFQQEGIARTIENILELMGFDPVVARLSRHAWTIREGSASLHLAYAEEQATLCAEVHLVRMDGDTDRRELMRFLLKENRHLTGYGFSIQDDLVVVALHIPAVFIREEGTSALFLNLLKECDIYDNQLVNVFGAKWIYKF